MKGEIAVWILRLFVIAYLALLAWGGWWLIMRLANWITTKG
jgi:TRAP-type C4-dicarboxylate transport system permease small subunit